MGKWEKQACFSKELALYKMRFVYYDLLSEKVGTRIISLNAAIIKKFIIKIDSRHLQNHW